MRRNEPRRVLVVLLDDVPTRLIEHAHAPNLKGLTRWTRFWGAPNCSNARALLESGTWTIDPLNRIGGVYSGSSTGHLALGPHLLARRVPDAAQVGKWHLCAHGYLTHRGDAGYVDYGGSQANLGTSGAANGGLGTYYDWTAVVNGQPQSVLEYATDWQVSRTVAQMQLGRRLVVCALNAVHTPLQAPPGYPPGSQNQLLRYMLEYADFVLGSVFAIADALRYAVLVAVDNGGTTSDGGKGNVSAKTLNSFAAFRNFQVLDANAPCGLVDLHATLVDLCTGLPPLAPCRGRSLLRAIPMRAYADHFVGVNVDPLPQARFAAVTNGVYKTIKDYAPAPGDPVWTDSTWDDRPIAPGLTADLRAAILARE